MPTTTTPHTTVQPLGDILPMISVFDELLSVASKTGRL